MSRIGKQPIVIPEKTEVTLSGSVLGVKGPLGEITRIVKDNIKIEILDREVRLVPREKTLFSNALWGTYASHLKNMIQGVNGVFEKKLVIEGIGFKADTTGDILTLRVGFSHDVTLNIPSGIKVAVLKNTISISGIDKEAVGGFAAHVRSIKKPEPYKGKGIRYKDEVVRRKQGKKAV